MKRPSELTPLVAVIAMFVALCAPARADAIDGDWCRADGKRMSIRGPAIVTPGGKETQGDYSRHFFSYTVPQGETGAGNKVSIIVFSGHSHPEMIRHTLAAGADAYVPKNGDYELLLDAIRDRRVTPGRDAGKTRE